MREGWDLVKLGSLCDIQNGFAFDSKLFNNDGKGLPLIRIRDIKRGYSETFTTEECDNAYVVKDGDYLIGMDGEFNIGQWKSENALLNQRVCKLLPSSKILPRFIYYYIPKALKDIEDKTAYATVKHLSSKQIKEIHIPNISLPEQQRIVDILDQEFAKIDALKANAEKSLQAAKDLFQATLKKELEPKEGWKTIKMGDYFRITSSKRVFQADWTDKGVPFYRAREIVKLAKYGSVNNDLFITPEMYDTYKAKYGVPKVGDVLITGVGTLGVCFLVENENPFYFKDGNVIWLQKEKEISSRYVIYCYQTNDVKEQVHSTQGAVVGTYTIEKANATTIPLPPTIEIQEEIVSRLDVLNDKCNALQKNYQKTLTLCDDLKQSLLRKAFNGEL